MKTNFKSIIIKPLICLLAVTLFMSCNEEKLLNIPDHAGIDAAIWDSEGSVQLHLNRAYDLIMPQFPYQSGNLAGNNNNPNLVVHLASDENILCETEALVRRTLGVANPVNPLTNNDVRYAGNKFDGNNVGTNHYFDLARVNVAIKFIPQGSMPKDKQDVFLGQYYVLRAMIYFDMAKVYGGVPLILEPVDPLNITVNGRNSAKEVFQSVLNDLDSALSKLEDTKWLDSNGRGKINSLIATCLKAKVLLYWASPQFNPTDNASHPYDASRWQTALDANKAAYDLCVASGYRLVPKYEDIFRLEGALNTEAILVRTFSNSLPNRGHDMETRCRPASAGGSPYTAFVASKNLLDAYPMKDGNPIGSAGAYTYDPVIFWVNRDPRFEATIAYNGCSWPLNGDATRRQWNYLNAAGETSIKGVYCKRFTTAGLAQSGAGYNKDIGGGNGMDWIELRLAEVMLNYAECANEIGDLTTAKAMVREIRKRAGIDQNPNDYGLSSVGTANQMRDLIMNERMIEFAFENKRNSDLRRTHLMHKLTGKLGTVSVEALNATQKSALDAIVPATGLRFRETIDINNKATYQAYFKTHVLLLNSNSNSDFAANQNNYFYTFNDDFVLRGAGIEPTIGWTNGTFDPLNDSTD